MPRLLIVDDDPAAVEVARRHLAGEDREFAHADSGEAGLDAIRSAEARGEPFAVVLLDFYMPGMNGVEVLRAIRELDVDSRVILTSGQDPREVAVMAMRHGAFDFVSKPVNAAELRLRVERALKDVAPIGASADAASEVKRPRKTDVIIGASRWTKELYERISMVAPTDVTVALYGKSGTGKELVARTIHNASHRHDRPFVVVNCGAIPENLLEDELFGHVKGAFTDASKDREGLFAAADGGTLFLDEIGEMPLSLQVKLLRVLQSQEFRRIGDDRDIRVDVRLITATNRNLEQAVETGAFRQDLYYRINVFPMTLPPLSERPEDVPLLAHHFLLKFRSKMGKRVESFSQEAVRVLMAYHWPGNVRELENKVHHALVMATGTAIGPEDLLLDVPVAARKHDIDFGRPFRDLKRDVVEAFEREYTTELLRRHSGNLAAAARQARIDRKNLWSLVKKYSIDVEPFRRN